MGAGGGPSADKDGEGPARALPGPSTRPGLRDGVFAGVDLEAFEGVARESGS